MSSRKVSKLSQAKGRQRSLFGKSCAKGGHHLVRIVEHRVERAVLDGLRIWEAGGKRTVPAVPGLQDLDEE